MNNTNRILTQYLMESSDMTENEISELRESTKIESIKDIAVEILRNINDKLSEIDTFSADRSRGDVKQIKELGDLQNCITSLEKLLDNTTEGYTECRQYLAVIIKSILYLNQYGKEFKDAYRNKKTLMIMKYESIVLSIISATSYLISVMVDFTASEPALKQYAVAEKIAPISTLIKFNESVESGEFRNITRDTNLVRECYLELSVERLSQLDEANDIISVVMDGIQNIYKNMDKGGKLTSVVYKAAGVVTLIFSLREIFYAMYKTRTKYSEITDSIANFANVSKTGATSKLISFANKFVTDAESATDLAHREIEDEDRTVAGDIKDLSRKPSFDVGNVSPEKIETPVAAGGYNFDF